MSDYLKMTVMGTGFILGISSAIRWYISAKFDAEKRGWKRR